MINTLRIYEELSQAMEETAARKLASVLGAMYEELQNTVTKVEFNELRAVMLELAEAQKRTEQRIEELTEAQTRTEQRLDALTQRVDALVQQVAELAEAQRRTDERVSRLEVALAELAEAQRRTDERISRLEVALAELAEAQRRTDERVSRLEVALAELAEAQRRTEQRVEELAQAQKRTEEAVFRLARRLDDTNKQLGGLADTVGYTLENEAYRYLPSLLERDFGVLVEESLYRDFLRDLKGQDVEVNILGRARRDSEPILSVGESKAQLSKRDVDTFLRKRVEKLDTGGLRPFPVLVAHMVTQRGTVEYARGKGVAVYLSYQFQQ